MPTIRHLITPRPMPQIAWLLLLGCLLLGCQLFGVDPTIGVYAADSEVTRATVEQIEFFERRVRPLLDQHCHKCHSADAPSPKGGLRLDSRAAMIKGGDSGAAIVPGDPEASLLMQSVRYESYEMPPAGKLPADQIAVLDRWIAMGAPWPDDATPQTARSDASYDWSTVRESHWSWQPIRRPSMPTVKDASWPQSPLDRFVLARLEQQGLIAAPTADRPTLIRRVYFDLIGLPPSPAAIDAFVNDDDPAPLARVIDHLLGSVQYGERWGRHWLDVARYSDGLGGFLDNARLPEAFRFRDWVVRSFNRDLPYDQFVTQQIAGDLVHEDESFYGPGFFAIGPTYISDGGDPESIAQAKSETLDDRVDTLSRAFLGLTVSCARCHDHKFDPIPTQDYYSLAGVFNNTRSAEHPLVDQPVVDAYLQAQRRINEFNANLTRREQELKKDGRQLTDDDTRELGTMRAELESLKKDVPAKYPVAHTLADSGQADMAIALRGDLRKPGEVAPRRFLRVLADDDRPRFTKGSGRVELAAAVVNPNNPLTPRVMANRIWLIHFGRGLVRSPSNFGTLGEAPTHPDLLDWLAAEFVASGWSIKQLHRTIMLSATYQMSSRFDADHFQRDGDNRLIWRMNPRRLDVEAWRDALLAVVGGLDGKMGGPPTEDLHDSRRRTLYSVVSRNGDRFESDEFLRLFDFPSPRATSAKRTTSTVPQQFLFMLNSPFMIQRARDLAARLATEANGDAERIDRAYQLLYARRATEREQSLGLQFLATAEADGNPTSLPTFSAWEQYAQILLSANEFMQVR